MKEVYSVKVKERWLIHISPLPIEKVDEVVLDPETYEGDSFGAFGRPEGFWFSRGDVWFEFIQNMHHEEDKEEYGSSGDYWYSWGSPYIGRREDPGLRYVYQIKYLEEKFFSINSYEKLKDFEKKFGKEDDEGDFGINWSLVKSQYAGVEVELPEWAQPEWMCYWDINSGCFWDPAGIKELKLLGVTKIS